MWDNCAKILCDCLLNGEKCEKKKAFSGDSCHCRSFEIKSDAVIISLFDTWNGCVHSDKTIEKRGMLR